jgi:hypothetical protein
LVAALNPSSPILRYGVGLGWNAFLTAWRTIGRRPAFYFAIFLMLFIPSASLYVLKGGLPPKSGLAYALLLGLLATVGFALYVFVKLGLIRISFKEIQGREAGSFGDFPRILPLLPGALGGYLVIGTSFLPVFFLLSLLYLAMSKIPGMDGQFLIPIFVWLLLALLFTFLCIIFFFFPFVLVRKKEREPWKSLNESFKINRLRVFVSVLTLFLLTVPYLPVYWLGLAFDKTLIPPVVVSFISILMQVPLTIAGSSLYLTVESNNATSVEMENAIDPPAGGAVAG